MGNVQTRSPSRLLAVSSSILRMLRLYWSNGSLKAWFGLLRSVGLHLCGRAGPVFLSLSVTNRCQMHCVHCYAKATDLHAR